MPCTSGIDYTQEKFDKVSRLLCFLCKQIELGDQANFDCAEYKEIWDWWQEHKELDRKRGNNNDAK